MRQRFAAALAAAGLLGGWSPILAQSPPSPPAPTASSPTYEATLVVTATLEPEPAAEIAATVEVIESEEIELRQSELVLDLLRTLPGLAVTQSGSPGKVASLFTRGTSSAHTLVLLDGVVLNDPVLGGFDWATPAPEGLERVEVVRGPYSALWGSSAVGGVVQLVTRAPATSIWDVRLEGGSHDYLRAGVSAAAPLGPLAFDLSGHLRRGEGELDNDFFDGEQAHLRADWRPHDGLRVGLLGRAADARIGLPFDFFGAPSPRREQASESELVALPVDWTRGDWRFEGLLARTDTELELSRPGRRLRREHQPRRAGAGARTRRLEFVVGVLDRAAASSASGRPPPPRARSAPVWKRPGRRPTPRSPRRPGAESARGSKPACATTTIRRFGTETSARGGVVVSLGRARAAARELRRVVPRAVARRSLLPVLRQPRARPERGESFELGVEAELGISRLRLAGFRQRPRRSDPVRLRDSSCRSTSAARGPRGRGLARVARGSLAGASRRDLARHRGPRHRQRRCRAGRRWSASGARFLRPGELDAGATVRYVGERDDLGGAPLASYTTVELAGSWRALGWLAPYARVENVSRPSRTKRRPASRPRDGPGSSAWRSARRAERSGAEPGGGR